MGCRSWLRGLVERFGDIVTAWQSAKIPALTGGVITLGVSLGILSGNEMRETIH
jgi:hypothetical protein